MAYTHGENGRGLISEENSRIQCERCEVQRKTTNGIDGRCEKSTECQ